MKDIIRMNQLAGIITEGQARKMMQVLSEADQPYKIISQKTRKNNFGDEIYDEYEIEINKETHTTPDGSTFDIETIGSVSIPQGEELDFSNPTHGFYYIETEIDNRIANIVDSAPSTLKTLKELATALNNDQNFSTSITNLIGTEANQSSTYTKTEVDNALILRQLNQQHTLKQRLITT